jgi:hypothetical protein
VGEGAAGAVFRAAEVRGVQDAGGADAGVEGWEREGRVDGEGGEVFCGAEGAEGHEGSVGEEGDLERLSADGLGERLLVAGAEGSESTAEVCPERVAGIALVDDGWVASAERGSIVGGRMLLVERVWYNLLTSTTALHLVDESCGEWWILKRSEEVVRKGIYLCNVILLRDLVNLECEGGLIV